MREAEPRRERGGRPGYRAARARRHGQFRAVEALHRLPLRAPAAEGASKEESNNSTKKKRNNKASLMVSPNASSSGNVSSGINL